MGELIDLEAFRRKRAEEEANRTGRPRRRRTPGGRGFDEDITRQLPPPGPSPDDGRDDGGAS